MEEQMISVKVFDRYMKILFARIDRLEAKIDSSKRTIQPKAVVINGNEYFDVSALSIIFQVTAHTIYRWRDEGKMPLVKMGGKFYIGVNELTNAMTSGTITEPAR